MNLTRRELFRQAVIALSVAAASQIPLPKTEEEIFEEAKQSKARIGSLKDFLVVKEGEIRYRGPKDATFTPLEFHRAICEIEDDRYREDNDISLIVAPPATTRITDHVVTINEGWDVDAVFINNNLTGGAVYDRHRGQYWTSVDPVWAAQATEAMNFNVRKV